MLCQECGKRPATLHFTKIINGDKNEFHICESCARERGEGLPGAPNGFSIHSLLSGLMDFEPSGKASSPSQIAAQALRCEECGLTYSQFTKLGRFGCSSCYKHFEDRLDPLFKRVHGSTSHVGKIPQRSGGLIKTRREIDRLRQEMKSSIQKEEFEAAARLRDEIRELEKQLNGASEQ
ncbi:protein arginine kinase activator [Paenibacillaceae bacterium GAS479]|nr:protein arginine kinase activator [Paenibacillaceae bacterium GAS479]